MVALLLSAGGAAVWFVFGQPRGEVPAWPVVDAGVPEVDAGLALSLSEGDALLRRWMGGSPELAKWLEGGDLLRRLTAAVNLVAEGESPRAVLTFLSLEGDFEVREEGIPKAPKPPKGKAARRKRKPPPERFGRFFIDPVGYERYDALTQVATSADAEALGKAYGQLRPYLDTAFKEIGKPGKRFDEVLIAAQRRLLSVPLPEGPVEVAPKGALWAFKDPALEARSPAEKHLLRMGPKNGQAVQAWIRRFSQSAGLPP